jgi:putative membrane protein
MIKYSCLTSLLAATVLWAAGTSVAQNDGSGSGMGSSPSQQQPPPGQGQPGQPGSPTSPGMGNDQAPGSAAQSSPQNYADQSFLRKTLEDSVAQVQMGQLAAQKSSSDDVKQFGQKMAQIHEQLNNQIEPVAKQLGVDQPKNPSKKDKQEIQKMQALSGPDFDQAFLTAMLKDQQTDVKGFKDEEKSAQDPTIQKLAQLDEPVLSQHLEILEQLAKQHNVPVETSKK